MSVLPLCATQHHVLRAKARRVETFDEALRELARDLIETMYANDGIGIAAPQIGRDVQLCIANPSKERGQEVVVANPMLDLLGRRVTITEGCLSVPNVWGKIKRAERVRLRGQNPSGQSLEIEAEGLLAVTLQHEVDHLHGTLFIDRLPWYQRRRIKARLAKAVCG